MVNKYPTQCGTSTDVPHYFFMYMKRLLLLLVSFATILAPARAKDERYIMKTFENGQVYFILPYDIPALTAKTKPLSVDITYLTNSDSVTMNMSVWTAEELSTDSIVFVTDVPFRVSDFQTLFIEQNGKLWMHRYSVRYPLRNLKRIYTASSPFVINIYAGEQIVQYGFANKAWVKQQEWMNNVLHIIDTNRRHFK